MTEADWTPCSDPERMLAWLHEQGKLSDRKARLFSVAVCRRLWPLLTDERSRRAVEVAERYADGLATLDELSAVSQEAIKATWAVKDTQDASWPVEPADDVLPAMEAAEMCAYPLPGSQVWGADGGYGPWEAAVAAVAFGADAEARDQERGDQACLLRCLLGPLPFRSVALDRSLLTSDLLALAADIYNSRDFAQLANLAALLEAQGSVSEPELRGHLKAGGPHARGCFGLDLVLGRE